MANPEINYLLLSMVYKNTTAWSSFLFISSKGNLIKKVYIINVEIIFIYMVKSIHNK